MLLGRAAIYFDEVARRGALRRAADVLHIAPSAVDRQILQLEEDLGTRLFERTPTGMRMTAAGELLVDGVRRWRRDLQRIRSEIDNLVGLRRGEVSVGLVEGAAEWTAGGLAAFRALYPGIHFTMIVDGAQGVVDKVMRGELDVGITFNPPDNPSLRLERTMIYQLGMVVPPDHPLAAREDVALSDALDHPLVLPAENLSLRLILERAWARHVGANLRGVAEVNSTRVMKALILSGVGVGFLTALDAVNEIASGTLRFLPLREGRIDLSTLSIVTASGRNLSVPATLFLQHIAQRMEQENVPTV